MSLSKQSLTSQELVHTGFRYAVSLTNDSHWADDLVQQACLKVIQSRGHLVGKSYLFTAIRNLFYDDLRSSQRKRTGESDISTIQDESISQTEDVANRIDLEYLLGKLKSAEREALYLNCVEEMTAAEISQLTGQSRGTVLSMISRAKEKLRQKYASQNLLDEIR